MALPSSIDSTTPAGSASPALGDDQIRALKLSIVDIFGVPDATSISVAGFAFVATGLDEIILRNAATDASGAGRLRRNATALTWHDGTAARNVYFASGTDVALADGGTGASLTDPNADRLMFWDDSAGVVAFLTASTGLSISGTSITTSMVGCLAGKSAVQAITSGTETAVTFNEEDFDTNSIHDNVTNNTRFTVPASLGGYWEFTFVAGYDSDMTTGGATLNWHVRSNGTTTLYRNNIVSPNTTNNRAYFGTSFIANLAAADYVELLVTHNDGADRNIGSATRRTFVSFRYLGA